MAHTDPVRSNVVRDTLPGQPLVPSTVPPSANATAHLDSVEYIVDECFFAVGQSVGMRLTVDYEAVVWWRDHFRSRFLASMQRFGNRWSQDRQIVTAVGLMLGERAVRYAAGRASIDLEAAQHAAADVERYCMLHDRR
jgi:hypothetical protein